MCSGEVVLIRIFGVSLSCISVPPSSAGAFSFSSSIWPRFPAPVTVS